MNDAPELHKATLTGHEQFIALRDELRARHPFDDLIEPWTRMNKSERRMVLRSAGLDHQRTFEGINKFKPKECMDIRAAVIRMSLFASGLRDHCQKRSERAEQELARNAREALDAGDLKGARHFIALIEAQA